MNPNHIFPHDTDNWDEFDQHATLKRYSEEKHVSAEELLMAVIDGLVDVHRMQRLDFPGEMPATLLLGVELLLRQEQIRNEEIHEQEAGEKAPQESDFASGMISGMKAYHQEVICDILCECIKAVGAKPIRVAA